MIKEIVNPKGLYAYSKEVLGCQRYSKEVMITIIDEKANVIDVFLTKEEAYKMKSMIEDMLESNTNSNLNGGK